MKNVISYFKRTVTKFFDFQSDDELKVKEGAEFIRWNLWEDEDEDVGIDYCYGIIDIETSKLLFNEINKRSVSSKIYIAGDVGELSDSNIVPMHELTANFDSFMQFQEEGFLKAGIPSRVFIFDETSSWVIHVDEFVLVVSDAAFIEPLKLRKV